MRRIFRNKEKLKIKIDDAYMVGVCDDCFL